jgi:hypothetical protein
MHLSWCSGLPIGIWPWSVQLLSLLVSEFLFAWAKVWWSYNFWLYSTFFKAAQFYHEYFSITIFQYFQSFLFDKLALFTSDGNTTSFCLCGEQNIWCVWVGYLPGECLSLICDLLVWFHMHCFIPLALSTHHVSWTPFAIPVIHGCACWK